MTIELNLSGVKEVVVRAIRNCEELTEVAVVLNCLVDLDDKNDLSMCVLPVCASEGAEDVVVAVFCALSYKHRE